MIYWHVERKSVCVYSQIKTCSSSEVAAMMEGLIRHSTDIDSAIEANYTDTHGASIVGFAFCHLLGYRLLPRIKAINRVRLYRPGYDDAYPQLGTAMMNRPIRWDLIADQYDQMIKYATAIRTRSAETAAILRRFQQANAIHPTYQAMLEVGRAQRTIFVSVTCVTGSCNARSTRGSTCRSRGTPATRSCTSARAATSPPTAATSRSCPCCAYGCCKPPWSTSTP